MRAGRNLARKLERLRPLWQSLSPRRRRQILVLQFLSLAAALGEVANLAALLPFLRLLANPLEGLRALGPVAAPLQMLPHSSLLLSLGLGFMAVVVVSTLIRVFTIRRQLHLAALITSDLGVQVLSAVLHKPFAWHLQHNSSGVISNLTKDVEQTFVMIQALLMLAVNVVIVVLLGAALLTLAPGLMLLIGAILAGFYLLVFRYTRGELRLDGERYTTHYQASLQVVQEALGGIRDVILDRSQPFFLAAYRGGNHTYLMAGAAINTKAQVPRYLIEGFAVMLIVALSLTLSLAGQGIERQLPLLGTLSLGAYRLLQPLQQCFIALSNLQANQASLLRLEPFLGVENPPPLRPCASLSWSTPPSLHTPLVELKDVGFRYRPDGPWVLHHLHLRIAPGERIAFVGSTGSGKSTTSDLILGLLAPNQGKVLVWGQDLHGSPDLVEAWQERVAHVPQQIYLSDASFAANIAFGIPEAEIDLKRVQHAAQQARIADLIEHSPLGYGTVVGERGVRLSGGQRQRIGIARALYKQAELLVLDEATSALDNRTEAEVMEAIESLDREITVILIAHRLSTVKHCDSIVMLERGMISGVGTFPELLRNHPGFQALARQREWSAS
jgi:ATP-binding cassette, subfamily B, bacterial PglK